MEPRSMVRCVRGICSFTDPYRRAGYDADGERADRTSDDIYLFPCLVCTEQNGKGKEE